MTTTIMIDTAPDAYLLLLEQVRQHFAKATQEQRVLFTTDAALYQTYLDGLPEDIRQHHTCNTCKRFIETFGGLAAVDAQGDLIPVMWNDATPEPYRTAMATMARMVRRARITGVFITDRREWGSAITGPWHHFSVSAPVEMLHTSMAKMAHERAAEVHEDYKTIIAALQEFNAATVDQAVTLLRSEQLYRSEKVLGAAEWLQRLYSARIHAQGSRRRDNLTWLAVATAPTGFCHPRSSMIGTLLEDIASGMDFAQASRRFAAKMRPDIYQRPQAAPAAGNIAQAEKLFEKLGLAAALRRRYARLDEIQAIWRSTPATPEDGAGGGIFGHLTPKGTKLTSQQMHIPAITITWEKFARTVLPDAIKIELRAPTGRGAFVALVTSCDPDAPPVLQWDSSEQRNPVSWYLWLAGSLASEWRLVAGQYHEVSAITMQPSMWYGNRTPHQGEGAILIIAGAKDSNHHRAGAALFPEILKSELHGVRSTIEAHSRSATMEGINEASACGLFVRKGQNIDTIIRVTTRGGIQEYRIDRWD